MTGDKLAEFCEALCQAIARGDDTFEVEGKLFGVTEGQVKAKEWLEAGSTVNDSPLDEILEDGWLDELSHVAWESVSRNIAKAKVQKEQKESLYRAWREAAESAETFSIASACPFVNASDITDLRIVANEKLASARALDAEASK